jgi:NAD(P)H-hydrate epimerase
MKKVVTAEEMREIDRKTINELGIPGSVLMERAGLAVVANIKKLFGRKRVIVLSGSGNNGGDGLVVARNLHNEGWDVQVFIAASPGDLKGDAFLQYQIAVRCGVSIKLAKEFLASHVSIVSRHCLIVDALLGTGLSKNVTGTLSDVIRIVNSSNVPVISVDIPSGISSDNGQIMGSCIKADCTVTFGLPKRGHLVYPGYEYSGQLFVEDIGFPDGLLKSEKIHVELIEKQDVSGLIPQRPRYAHKGHFGHVLIVAGSKGKTGAAFMAAKACLRAGAGLVTIGIPESLSEIFQSRVTEEMTLVLPDKGNGTLSQKGLDMILDFLKDKADILAIGPGIGVSRDTEALVSGLVRNASKPLVIDADGINALRVRSDILKKAKSTVILTPHPGEMARLLQQSAPPPIPPPRGGRVREGVKAPNSELITQIENDRINTSISFAKETGTYLVLKGAPTLIASPEGMVYINSTGNPGMAGAGTGDVLTGMISGLLGQIKNPLNACIAGVYIHGLAGDIASNEKGQHSMIASDIIEKIPDAFSFITQNG